MVRASTARPIIVVSMHRSGSSLVASLLSASGVHMGSRLMPAGCDNPLGFFENLDFVEFHERWLRLNGHDTSGWVAPQQLELPDEACCEAAEILNHNNIGDVWGWKDPRTALFAEFWSAIVPNAKFVCVYREPAEVVDSLLRRRDKAIVADPELAVRSWVSLNSRIFRLFRIHRPSCILVNVKVIAREPRRFLGLVAERLEVPLNVDAASPFDSDLLNTLDSSGQKATLLRYLVPESERLYLDLELEADLAGGVHRDGSVTPRRARRAFFGSWLDDAGALHSSDSAPLSEAETSLAAMRAAVKRHQTALSKFASRSGEE